MDESAIRLIQRTAIDADDRIAEQVDEGEKVALPNDYTIHDLEQYRPGRRRFRGTLRTDSLGDFVGYVTRRATDAVGNVPGFINAEKLSSTVLFNLGDVEQPGHADDTAVLTLQPSAPYAALTQVNGRQLAHKDALDWLEDWADNLSYLGADESGAPVSIAASVALAAIRKITIRATAEKTSSQENYRATRSALEDVETRGAAQLPAEVLFQCTPYAGLPARTFRLRLAVLTSTDKPVLVLRVRNLEAEKEAIAQDFKRALLTDLEDVATLTIGTFIP